MRLKLGAAMMTIALLAGTDVATIDPARSFLMSAFNLSAADIERLDRGEVVSRTLDVKNRREVATLGIVRIQTSPSHYVERLADITEFKRTPDVVQIGTFSDSPQLSDVAALIIDDADLKRLRDCRVENCDLRLAANGIERVRREIDWRAADASPKASRLVLELLVDYVAGYRQNGMTPAMEYADRAPRLNVGNEFVSLLDADTITSVYAPRLRTHLLEFPTSSPEQLTDFIYWSK